MKKRYVYHFYASYSPLVKINPESNRYDYDGLFYSDIAIQSLEQYNALKATLGQQFKIPPERIVIKQLGLLAAIDIIEEKKNGKDLNG